MTRECPYDGHGRTYNEQSKTVDCGTKGRGCGECHRPLSEEDRKAWIGSDSGLQRSTLPRVPVVLTSRPRSPGSRGTSPRRRGRAPVPEGDRTTAPRGRPRTEDGGPRPCGGPASAGLGSRSRTWDSAASGRAGRRHRPAGRSHLGSMATVPRAAPGTLPEVTFILASLAVVCREVGGEIAQIRKERRPPHAEHP
jgi:hypothetical protein